MVVWAQPADAGDEITAYQVQLYVPASDSYIEDLSYCDGSVQEVIDGLSCQFPQLYLGSTYGYTVGSLLQVRVRAFNVNGWGEYSQLNTGGAIIQNVPTVVLNV